jgi:hypothetical protein
MRFILTLITFLSLILTAFADNQEFNVSKVRNKRTKTPMDVLVLEMQMGESGYQVSKSIDNKARLLATYEKAINEFCFNSLLTTYKYSFDANNIKCADQITKMLALDSTSPAAVCAQSGMDSSPCDLAYASQKIGLADAINQFANIAKAQGSSSASAATGLVPTEVSESLDLQERLRHEKNDIESGTLKGRYQAARSAYSANKNQENRTKVEASLAEWITESCREAEVRYVKNGQVLNRMRLLPGICLEAVNEGRAFDKNFVSAVCNQEGFYTPNCTKARRLRAAMSKPKTTPTPPVAGLATF